MYKSKLSLLLILFIFFSVSCTSKPLVDQDSNNIVGVKPEDFDNTDKKDLKSVSVNLFNSEKTYDEDAIVSIYINNEKVRTRFVVHKYSDFGLYIPSTLSVNNSNAGNTLYNYLDEEEEYITLIDGCIKDNNDFNESIILAKDYIKSIYLNSEVAIIEDLAIYSEYIGSIYDDYPIGDGIRKVEDYFLFKPNDKNLIIKLTYNDSSRNRILPIFLEVIKNIKYIQVEEDFKSNTVNLFNSDKVYNGKDTISMNINNEEVTAKFVLHKYSDFGLYLPDIIYVKNFEDGNEFYFKEGEYITLMDGYIEDNIDFNKSIIIAKIFLKNIGSPTITMIEDLAIYTEYIGSKLDDSPNGKEVDYFLFKYNGKNLIIGLTYNINNRNIVLPTFLEVIKTIKFIQVE